MEESEKRKERLKAMRMEAVENYRESATQSLANPLIDSPIEQAEVYDRPRFDYYTDPMAAFSGNKKKNNTNISAQVSQQPCYTPPRPRNPDSPNYPARGEYTFSPLGNPGGSSPFGTPPRSSPNAWGSFFGTPNSYAPPNSSTGSNFASPGIHQGGRPCFHYGQGRGQPGSGYPGGNSPLGTPPRSSPNAWGSSFGTANSYAPPNSTTGGDFASPGIHQGGRPSFHYGQGRGQPGSGYPGGNSPFGTPPRSSPNSWGSSVGTPNSYIPPNSSTGGNFASPGIYRGGRPGFHHGQGRGQPGPGYRGRPGPRRGRLMGNISNPDSSQSGRRGLGSHERTSAESRPDRYYDKSMVEDPWEQLSPVIWKPLNAPANSFDTPGSSKSWLPESVSTKKPKFSGAPVKPAPQQSLAEYLAASLNEATAKEAVNNDVGT